MTKLIELTGKELSAIAKKHDVSLTYKGENGARKRYNKPELVAMIEAAQSKVATIETVTRIVDTIIVPEIATVSPIQALEVVTPAQTLIKRTNEYESLDHNKLINIIIKMTNEAKTNMNVYSKIIHDKALILTTVSDNILKLAKDGKRIQSAKWKHTQQLVTFIYKQFELKSNALELQSC